MIGVVYMYQCIRFLLKYIYVIEFVTMSSFQWKDIFEQNHTERLWTWTLLGTNYYTNSTY